MLHALREDVEVHSDPATGGVLVIDRAVGRWFRLGPAETATLGAPDERLLAELRALGLAGRPARARLARIRRVRGLFQDPPAALVRGQLRDEPLGPEGTAGIRFLEGTAFACQMTGACCRRFLLGPLTDDDIAKIEAYDFPAESGLPSGRAAWEDAGAGIRALRRRDGRCVFLGPDGRCEVHRRLGGDRKPMICRLFPFRPVRAGGAIRVSLSSECSAFERADRPPAGEDALAAEVEGLLREAGRVPAAPARVLVRGVEMDQADLLARDAGAIRALLDDGDAPLADRLSGALACYGPARAPSARRRRPLFQDLRCAAIEGRIAPNLLDATRLAYRRLAVVLEPANLRAPPLPLDPDAARALARALADALFGLRHLRAPDAFLGAAVEALHCALAARDARVRARGRGAAAASVRDAREALRDLGPAFETAGGLRAVLLVALLEAGFDAAGAAPAALL